MMMIPSEENTSSVPQNQSIAFIDMNTDSFSRVMAEQVEEERRILIMDSNAINVDLSAIRGIPSPEEDRRPIQTQQKINSNLYLQENFYMKEDEEQQGDDEEGDLEGLAELVPALKTIKSSPVSMQGSNTIIKTTLAAEIDEVKNTLPHYDSMVAHNGAAVENEEEVKVRVKDEWNTSMPTRPNGLRPEEQDDEEDASESESLSEEYAENAPKMKHASVPKERSSHSSSISSAGQTHASDDNANQMPIQSSVEPIVQYSATTVDRSNPKPYHAQRDVTPPHHGRRQSNDDSFMTSKTPSPNRGDHMPQSSVASLSTTTQSNELRMPMYLPNFRPATGCTNASDFIVRCFVARLRSGITVVKHGRSRWCKSRLRVLHVHSDGRSLSWRPAQGEPTSNKRPPRLDLSTCLEVRHAWSPDPLNPMFTGTPILRSKCEPSNAFKSFALIFPKRTVDITAVTADQCKVLMEGFSALCFRLHVANMAGIGQQEGVKSSVNDSGMNDAGPAYDSDSKEATGTSITKFPNKTDSVRTAPSSSNHLHPDQIPR